MGSSYDISDIKKRLKKELDKERYKHTKGVANTAVGMAMRYGFDLDIAYLAGMLHDCAKCIPDKEKYSLCSKYKIRLTSFEKQNPSLIHAKLGAYIAKNEYKISDKDVIAAIRWHTTGHKNMSLLEKIIFIADYIEPGRTKQKNLKEIRQLAFTDIDECMYTICRDTLEYLDNKSSCIDLYTKECYDYYNDIHQKLMQ